MPRKEDRIAYRNEIILEWSSGKREATISDVSPGGCYVDTIATIPEGESIAFELRAADGTSVKLTGDVAYVLPGFGFGIEFTNLTDEKKEFLERIIASAE